MNILPRFSPAFDAGELAYTYATTKAQLSVPSFNPYGYK